MDSDKKYAFSISKHRNKVQILIWYIAIILYLRVFPETVMSVVNGITVVQWLLL